MKASDIKGEMTQNGSGWKIRWSCKDAAFVEDHAVSLDFEIVGEDGDTVLDGFIKWDGCSNWREPDGMYFHLCGLLHVQHLTDALNQCYAVAKRYMPEAE